MCWDRRRFLTHLHCVRRTLAPGASAGECRPEGVVSQRSLPGPKPLPSTFISPLPYSLSPPLCPLPGSILAHHSLTPGVHGRLGPVGEMQLAQDIAHMPLDRLFAQHQQRRHLGIRLPIRDQLQDLQLALA